jgi:hypothetical protein
MADSGVVLSGWDRVAIAVENVRKRLLRAAAALEGAAIPYAVVGGNAVAEWVGRVDPAAVRNTQDVDILLRREDLPAAITAMAKAGFVHRHAASIDMFLDGPSAKARDAVHVVFANEKVRAENPAPAPDVTESTEATNFRVIALEPLVRMKLISFRLKDRVHLQDLLGVGQVDEAWKSRLPPQLADRLQQILDDPHG